MNLPIVSFRTRVVALILGICMAVLVVATVVLTIDARSAAREGFRERAQLEAAIVAETATAALVFEDAEGGNALLEAMAVDPSARAAWLVGESGVTLSTWTAPDVVATVPPDGRGAWTDESGALLVARDVKVDGEIVGRLVAQFDLSTVDQRLRGLASHAALVLLAGLALAGLIAARLQRVLSRPIERLDATTREITSSGDYTIRAEVCAIPEVGRLAENLNGMLEVIGERGQALEQMNATLEQRVQRRTEDLRTAITRMQSEIEVRQEAERRLRSAQEKAEAANQAKSEFLANMSHEIRTPMTAILGFAELLNAPGTPDVMREEAAATIKRNGEHLLAIINDILDLSKIEAGHMEVESLDVDLRELLEDVRALMSERADSKGLTLDVTAETPLPATIKSDPVRLRQILVNLLGNAIKFTELGTVTLAAAIEPVAGGRFALRLDIRDSGIGIDEEGQARLFQPFAQADGSMTRRFGGTGLGLAISRRLATILGGDIELESEVGKGSTFTVRIDPGPLDPAAFVDPARAVAPETTESSPAGSAGANDGVLTGLRVLLVEDGPDNQRLISHLLRAAGAEVEVRGDGREGVDAVLGPDPIDPHVVVMDMQMPVLDGYSATRELRARGWDGPVVALTAHAMSGDRERCLEAGCDDYLTKPVDQDGLVAMVRTWADRGEPGRRAA